MDEGDLPQEFRTSPSLNDEREVWAPVLSEQQEVTDGKVAQLLPVASFLLIRQELAQSRPFAQLIPSSLASLSRRLIESLAAQPCAQIPGQFATQRVNAKVPLLRFILKAVGPPCPSRISHCGLCRRGIRGSRLSQSRLGHCRAEPEPSARLRRRHPHFGAPN
jgi:hypothetical protein